MPYLLPRSLTRSRTLAFILAFGDLSHLEICAVLGGHLLKSERPSPEVSLVELKDEEVGYEKLAGVHKVVVPIPNLEDFLGILDDNFNFSVSLYGDEQSKEGYEDAISVVLDAVREAGRRKANLVRPRNGTEVLTKEIVSREIIDFILLRRGEKSWIGVTCFIPDTQQFQQRSNERPVVSADIAISSRLAKLLVNLAGVKKGQTVLDPFCGSGTILSEALLAGASCIGVDRDRGRIQNAQRNLEWVTKARNIPPERYTLSAGDATRPETFTDSLDSVDAVISEPIFLPPIDHAPSTEKARKLIRNSSRLYSEGLYSFTPVVKRGGRVILVTPALRTSADKEVSVLLENVEEVGLRPFRPESQEVNYPVRISNEKTRWVKRLVYVFERV